MHSGSTPPPTIQLHFVAFPSHFFFLLHIVRWCSLTNEFVYTDLNSAFSTEFFLF